MKIGIDIRSIGKKRTGDETYTKNLVKNLLKIDQDNQYFFYTNTDDESQLREIKNKIDRNDQFKNYKIISIKPAHKMLWTFYVLPKYLKKNPVDILHVQYITPIFLPKGINLITTIHDVSFNAFPQHIKKSDLFFLKTLIPWSLKKADKIIAVSKFTKEEIVKYYKISTEKIKVIYNGGASPEKQLNKNSKEDQGSLRIKNKYNLPADYIFYVGTFQPRKNIPFLLKGFKKLKQNYKNNEEIKNIKLVIGGKRFGHNYDRAIDDELKKIKTDSKEIFESIIFTDYIADADLPFLYRNSRVFCFPSKYEGFGLPIIEAMFFGAPVLCNNSSCFPEIAGEGAEYYKKNDFEDFTKKMYNIIINNEKRNNLIARGRKRAYFFSWDKCAEETLGLYKKITGK